MKQLFSFLILLFSGVALSAQDNRDPVIASENTFAVVIGIANYENENINLNYANRDAQVFANYLQSKSGGAVPSENIRLLIDTVATTAAIYNALNWLRDKCELNKIENNGKPAKVYFYFSGHGDVETDTRANLGFLIAFNTPANNYINNAVRIEDLNNYAHTLSVDLNANVVIITDACHSGKLAGSDNNGSFLVGKELSTAKQKEIRIASCKPNELSNEDERWDGGRGVFSYYLINGLKGLADKDKDNFVTLDEIKNYVDSSIAVDPVLRESNLKQTPVLEGNQQFKLSLVNDEDLSVLQSMQPKIIPQTNQDYFFSLLKNNDSLELVNYKQLNSLSKNQIPFAFIAEVKKLIGSKENSKSMDELAASIRNDPNKLKVFNESLIELIHTRGQKVINFYLEGDAAELERRRYYSGKNSGYDNYSEMYAVASKLVEAGNQLAHILQVNQIYFTGVAARLRLPFVNAAEQKKIIEQAIVVQQKALALEDNAAYLHNELGVLYNFKKENGLAEKYYRNATMLAPNWAIPWANLCGLYADTHKMEESFSAGQTAERLQPSLQLAHLNLGTAWELSGNYLFAEEYYRTAIDINSRHYVPFERLGYIYMNTTQYALADSFFYEADLRKRGYNFQANELIPVALHRAQKPMTPLHCDFDTTILADDDFMGFFTWGVQEYEERNYSTAVRVLKKVIAIDKTNPLVFHYMGKIFYDQKKWEDAELMFKLAVKYYKDSTDFNAYCDSFINKKASTYLYDYSCFEKFFKAKYYDQVEDEYFLGSLYESWSHNEEAEIHFRKIIRDQPYSIGGYIKLWQLMERSGRFTETESIIKSFAAQDTAISDRELNAFYRRAIEQFPGNADWYYRLGLFLYEKATFKPVKENLDTIIYFPRLNKEVFIDLDTYMDFENGLSWDTMIPGSPKAIKFDYTMERAPRVVLPGTKQIIVLSDIIYTPRKDAITYLTEAENRLTETAEKADINFKIGNVFVWSGSKKQALPYYTKAVELDSNNASARLNLVDVAGSIYKNRAGMEQLRYLYAHQQINFAKRLLYAEYAVYAGEFDKAKKLLEEAQAIHPYTVPETLDLMGRLYFVSKQTVNSIKWYNDYLSIKPNDPFTLYTIAKLNMQSNKTTDAWKYLEAAMKNGFNYMYVLNADPAWNNFRKDNRWTNLLKKYPVRKYFYPPVPSHKK